jgi:hypothetical protein
VTDYPIEPLTFADQVKAAAPVTGDDAARLMADSEGREKPKASRQRKPKPAEALREGDLSATNEDAESIRRAFVKGGIALAKSVGRAMGWDDEAIEALFRLQLVPEDGAIAKPTRRRKAKGDDAAAPVGSEGGEPPSPRDRGFDLERMNGEFAILPMGSKAVILHEQELGPIEDRVRILTVEAFKQLWSNRFTEYIDKDCKLKAVPWPIRWLAERGRRQYRGIEFFPNPDGAASTPAYFNLWRGFSIEPDASAGKYTIFRDHLLTNLCNGDEKLYRWVFAFFAHMVQRPRERVGTAVVFRGGQGSGKTKIGQVFGSLFLSHYFLVDDPRYLTGNFNAHMAACLLLQADEGFWAGDKGAEGRLKGLITADTQMIEAKGVDPIRLKNFVRVLITSNHDWVIPAGKDERRFCVLDISDRVAQNHAYFAEMDEELDAGGRAALLADLLAFDLSTVNLRQIPRTEALLEQKLRSLEPIESWWHDRLMAGTPTSKGEGWVSEAPIEGMFDDYIATADKIGVKRKAELVAFGIKMKKLVGPERLKRIRPSMDVSPGQIKRVFCYRLPSLQQCRDAFEEALGQSIDWGEHDDG